MKNSKLILAAAAVISLTAFSSFASDTVCAPSVWSHIQAAAKQSAAGLESTYRSIDSTSAEVTVQNRTFALTLSDSAFADSGDLNDVVAKEIGGECEIELRSVFGAGDLLEALGVNQPNWSINDVRLAP